MIGCKINKTDTLRFIPPQGRGGAGMKTVMYVWLGMKKTLKEAHEVAQEELRAAQKSIKRNMINKKYIVGDSVYWRRNAGLK